MREDETHQATLDDKKAPMAAAPMRYRPDGEVDWGNMWDSFCVLASEGGPPHRADMLYSPMTVESNNPAYQLVVQEIIRGIGEVSGLPAEAGPVGWVKVGCESLAMAEWLADNINQENVQARQEGAYLLVPAGADFSLKGEIKNVITAVAKTSHYWRNHLPIEVKRTLAAHSQLRQIATRLLGQFRRPE